MEIDSLKGRAEVFDLCLVETFEASVSVDVGSTSMVKDLRIEIRPAPKIIPRS